MAADLMGRADCWRRVVTDKPIIQDPNVEPPGYKPPTSAEELRISSSAPHGIASIPEFRP